MMPADAVLRAAVTGGCLHGCLMTATGQVTGREPGRGAAVATLISWLLAESLGAYMLRTWLVSGGRRPGQAGQEAMSPALIAGHAGLAFAGLVSWIGFLISSLPALAWLSIGLLAPAIGLGISTVTVWTPYPVSRLGPGQPRQQRPAGPADAPAILVTNEMLDRVLANESLTSELVDDLVERMLAEPPSERRASRRWQLAPVIPILHGVLALATFLLAVLAAVAAGG